MNIKEMSAKEFREKGYLQELNRRFLHPLGLAISVVIDDKDGEESLGVIWDYREDEEGMYFALADPTCTDEDRMKYFVKNFNFIESELKNRKEKRVEKLGFFEEPISKCEGYPDDWKHCTLHISPYGEDVHGDGDPSILRKFKEMQQGIVEYRSLIKELVKLNLTLTNLVPSDLPIKIPCKKCKGSGHTDEPLFEGKNVFKQCSECKGIGKCIE